MKNYLRLSNSSWLLILGTAALIGLALVGVQFGIPVIGLPAILLLLFVLPGLVILHKRIASHSLLETLFLSTVLSTSLSGLVLYAGATLGMPVSGKWMLLMLTLLLLGATLISRPFASTNALLEKLKLQKAHQPLLAALGVYIVAHLLSMVLYPFIPEADGYGVVIRIREIIETGSIANVGYRPLFPLLTAAVSSIAQIDTAVLVKYLIPLLLSVTTIPLYLIARGKTENRLWQFLVCILPLTVPVIFQETEIVRTQTFLMFTSFSVLYLLRFKRNVEYGMLALLISGVSIFAHELGFILLAITLVVFVIHTRRYILRHWPVMLVLAACMLLNAYFILNNSFVGSEVLRYAKMIYSNVVNGHFDWWFIDSYRNVDGSQLGWPGKLTLLYYGYNLGLAIPVVFLLWIARRAKLKSYVLAPVLLIAFALIVAELLPRVGLAFLPDRAWLFLSIGLAFLLAELSWEKLSRSFMNTMAGIIIASIAISILVTPVRGGWVTTSDYAAAKWIETNTSQDALILSQGGNGPAVLVYADRTFINAAPLFALGSSLSKQDVESFVRMTDGPVILPHDEVGKYITTLQDAEIAQWTKLQELLETEHTDTTNVEVSSKQLSDALRLWRDTHSELARIIAASESTAPTGEAYIMFSTNKLSGLYGTREWWKEMNAITFNVDTLTRIGLEPVYSEQGVYIFRVQ